MRKKEVTTQSMKPTENPVCTTDFDLPTPPWGNEWGDPGEPHPDEPGLSRYGTTIPGGPEPEPSTELGDTG
jgi:hypothetical protein